MNALDVEAYEQSTAEIMYAEMKEDPTKLVQYSANREHGFRHLITLCTMLPGLDNDKRQTLILDFLEREYRKAANGGRA